jgi:hypothetical protein
MAEAPGATAYLRQQQAIMSRPDSRPTLAAISCVTSQPHRNSRAKSPLEFADLG